VPLCASLEADALAPAFHQGFAFDVRLGRLSPLRALAWGHRAQHVSVAYQLLEYSRDAGPQPEAGCTLSARSAQAAQISKHGELHPQFTGLMLNYE
jgi:hypothetical protein